MRFLISENEKENIIKLYKSSQQIIIEKVLLENYPYDDLKKNPTPELIAKVLKDANGGWLSNDKEAWAEAAFFEIKSNKTHDEVAKLLGLPKGQRVIDYILTFMSQSELERKFHVKPISDHETFLVGNKNSQICKSISNKKAVDLIIDHIEGGYYNPQTHYDSGMGDSGETLFGIDRKHSPKEFTNSSEGQEFWRLIDQDRKMNPKKWKRYYMLDDNPNLREKLKQIIAGSFLPPIYKRFSGYLDEKTKSFVDCDPRLSFHMIYAVWNGEGWFRRFADKLNEKVKQGVKNTDQLFKVGLNQRKNSSNGIIAKSGRKIEQEILPNLT